MAINVSSNTFSWFIWTFNVRERSKTPVTWSKSANFDLEIFDCLVHLSKFLAEFDHVAGVFECSYHEIRNQRIEKPENA